MPEYKLGKNPARHDPRTFDYAKYRTEVSRPPRSAHWGNGLPFTMLANLGWHPAISLPAGLTAGGLPVGLQVMCRRHADEVVLRLARLYEQARPWPRVADGYEPFDVGIVG